METALNNGMKKGNKRQQTARIGDSWTCQHGKSTRREGLCHRATIKQGRKKPDQVQIDLTADDDDDEKKTPNKQAANNDI